MSSGESEYISAAAVCMTASHLHMLTYDLNYLGNPKYDGDNLDYEPAKIIIDDEISICMAKCNKDAAANKHVAWGFHCIRHGIGLKEHKFEWIGTKSQMADILIKLETNPLLDTCGH